MLFDLATTRQTATHCGICNFYQNAVLERHTHIGHRRCKRLMDSVAPARLPALLVT